MTTKLSPIASEFDTQEQADSYDRWLRAKVEAAMNSAKPRIPHDEVMAEINTRLKEKRKLHNTS